MNLQQFRRYDKIFIEEFFLLDWRNREKEIWFAITGSTYIIYEYL